MKIDENVLEMPLPTDSVAAQLEDDAHFSAMAKRWMKRIFSPLWLCLLLALGIRVWLVMHTHGFLDTDEALLGVQAQHILQGEHPIYYYGQPYMGSLEAYLVAIVFALVGSSVWTLRIVPLMLSLVLVWLTWCLAGVLADRAKLASSARCCFMTIAALLATLPPLYDVVMELRTWGGHIEIYILMLLLLYAIVRLTQRWDAGASRREIAMRWAGIGFMIGLGVWIYPLVASAVLTVLVWMALFFLQHLAPHLQKKFDKISHTRHRQKKNMLLAIMALPAGLLGFAPGIYWGIYNRWANIFYLFAPGSDGGSSVGFLKHHPDRLVVLGGTIQLYLRCIVPEIIGGSLPSEPVTSSSAISFQLLIAIGIASLGSVVALFVASFFLRHPLLNDIQRLAALPLLFAGSTIFIFCFSSVVGGSIFQPCTRDGVGRYAAPLLLALPLIGATLGTAVFLYLQEPNAQKRAIKRPARPFFIALAPLTAKRGESLLALFLVAYLATVGYTYMKSDANYVFQSFTCLYAPSDNGPIVAYMQREHIRYAWGTITLGNPIMFETSSQIIVSDPRIFTLKALDRLPQNALAVKHADRASLLDMVPRTDRYPATLKALDQAGIRYHVSRFPTSPGNMAVLVITPLNQTLKPSEARSLGSWRLLC